MKLVGSAASGSWESADIDVVAHDRDAVLRRVPGQGLARARIQHLNDQRTTRLHVHVHLCTTDAIAEMNVRKKDSTRFR